MASPDESMSMSLATGAKLTVPEGAVSDAVEIAMQRPSDMEAMELVKSLPSSMQLASAPYVLTPHGLRFEQPVELTLPIGSTNGRQLAVAYLEDETDDTWETVGAPEISGDNAKLQIDHFSVWMLVELQGECVVDADDDLDEAIDEGSCGTSDDDAEGRGSADGSEDSPAPEARPTLGGAPAMSDAGAGDEAPGDEVPMSSARPVALERCGNGIVDSQESCDIAIPTGTPGACPTVEACKSMGQQLMCLRLEGDSSPACLAICTPTSTPPAGTLGWQECASARE